MAHKGHLDIFHFHLIICDLTYSRSKLINSNTNFLSLDFDLTLAMVSYNSRSQRVLTKCEPASHASHASHHVSHASHHVNHARQMLVHSPFSFLRLLAAFGYLARVFAILALLAISFCYLPLSFSSFVKVSYVFVLLSLNFEV